LFLKSLQIQGFKSFPDKVKLEFGPGITATVGPNGSGKSNISDAVRWVLGEQSTRTLRVKSMEEVIFEGTSNRKAAGFAEVIMTIDNTGRWLHYDADEVAICRRYYRSGNSEYRINGKSSLLREINELFMDTGIGRDGYSMISQGKVSEIVEVKPTDRRTVFEEAAGISMLRARRSETEKNLEKTEENLRMLENNIYDLEQRVGPLEKESEKAKKAIELGEQLKKEEIGLWLLTLDKSTGIMRDQSYRATLLGSQYDELVEKAEVLDAEIDKLFADSNELLAQKDEQLRSAAAMEEQAARLDGEAEVVRTQLAHDRQDIERIEKEIAESEQGEELLRKAVLQKQTELTSKQEEAARKQEEVADFRRRIEELRSDESGQSAKLLELRGQQNELTLTLSEQQLTVARAQMQLDEITGRAGGLAAAIAERTQRCEKLEGELSEARIALEQVREKASELGNAISGHRLRLDSQRRRAEEAKKNADDLRLDAQDKRRRAKTIEDLENSLEGYDHSVRRVIKHAREGGLRGIHGPVSQVIEVQPKYAVAVEIALGAAVKNIIVDNETDGKRAVEYLKSVNGGRATFLPISVIRPRSLSEKDLDECAGYVDIASSLVKCEDRYRDIIENLLGNVCVVEDMDSAISIARRYKNRFRLVTLDGQVINAGGSMTGGSLAKNTGLLSRKGELEQLRAQADKLEAKAAEAAREAEAQRQKAAAEEAALLAVQSELSCANEDRVGLEADVRRLDEQLAQMKELLEAAQEEQNGASGRTEKLTAQRDEAQKLADASEAELAQLNSEIERQTGSMDELSAKREELSAQMNEAGMAQIALTTEAEGIEAAIAEINSRIEGGSTRGEELRAGITALEQHIEELMARSDDIAMQAADLRRNASESSEGVSDIERRRDELEIKIRQKREESRQAAEQREGVSNEKNRLEERMAQTRKEHDSILLRMLESYSLTRREAEEQFEPAENERAAQKKVGELKGKIRALGHVNMGAIEEYKEVSEKYNFLSEQIKDVTTSKQSLEKMITELTQTMQTMFVDAFGKISKNFSEIFPELYGGGTARLALMDESDVLNCGIDIDITPPGAGHRTMTGMSGGENSLIAVAIYFAIMKVRPSPFCFLDEVDHALDESNVNNLARYIKRFTNATQYIVITHRRGMMEAADRLYGVTKQDRISRLLQLNLDEVDEKLGKLDG